MNNMIEKWSRIPDFKFDFSISTFGRVRNNRTGNILRLWVDNSGYLSINQERIGTGKNISIRVHRLVAKAFIPNPNNFKCVNHKDSDKHNNHIDNLEWCTHAENTMHYYKQKFDGNYIPKPLSVGEKNKKRLKKKIENPKRNHKTVAVLPDGVTLEFPTRVAMRTHFNIKHKGITSYINKGIPYNGIILKNG